MTLQDFTEQLKGNDVVNCLMVLKTPTDILQSGLQAQKLLALRTHTSEEDSLLCNNIDNLIQTLGYKYKSGG